MVMDFNNAINELFTYKTLLLVPAAVGCTMLSYCLSNLVKKSNVKLLHRKLRKYGTPPNELDNIDAERAYAALRMVDQGECATPELKLPFDEYLETLQRAKAAKKSFFEHPVVLAYIKSN